MHMCITLCTDGYQFICDGWQHNAHVQEDGWQHNAHVQDYMMYENISNLCNKSIVCLMFNDKKEKG